MEHDDVATPAGDSEDRGGIESAQTRLRPGRALGLDRATTGARLNVHRSDNPCASERQARWRQSRAGHRAGARLNLQAQRRDASFRWSGLWRDSHDEPAPVRLLRALLTAGDLARAKEIAQR